jgi:Uma2 family endonuclease
MTTSAEVQTILPKWQPATWEDYLAYYDNPAFERARLFFNQGCLFIDMTPEGIEHASTNDLFTMLFVLWFSRRPEQTFSSLGRCSIEKPNKKVCQPDLVLYTGAGAPGWQPGERRCIDLTQWRVPDLVGEISDTTLAADLDEKKRLYADLVIPEYWVADVRGRQVIAFRLQEGQYQQCHYSVVLKGLPISLLEQTLERLSEGTNGSAALWFAQQISSFDPVIAHPI